MEPEERKMLDPVETIPCPPANPRPLRSKGTHVPKSFAREIAKVAAAESECHESCLSCYGSCCGCIGTCCSCCNCSPYVTIPQGSAGILAHFGRAYRIVDPGLYFVNPKTEHMHVVNVKVNITDIPRQLVITKDNVVVNIDSVLYWHIVDPLAAVFNVDKVESALLNRTVTTLRATIGAHELQVVVGDRQTIAAEIHRLIYEVALAWGVVVESILINDLKFTGVLADALSAVAKQRRVGESKIIAAKAEVEAAKLMREASEFLNTPAAFQMKYLETLDNMAKNPKTRVVYTSGTEGGLEKVMNAYLIDKITEVV